MTATRCPLCSAVDATLSVHRNALPTMQNVVYSSAAAACAARTGVFDLATCGVCGFSWNAAFDPALAVYDEHYDNHVASAAFNEYYASLAQMLIDRFGIVDGTVYDIGCGKGEFLRVFARLAPGVRCIGIDPSCTPVDEGNFTLRRMRFDASVFGGDARLVLLRHVLEHIDTPLEFLAALRDAMPAAPLYVEVPDLDWILGAGAFWDFCYEHCNYFTPASLAVAIAGAGFVLADQRSSFDGQYQWAIAEPGAVAGLAAGGTAAAADIVEYLADEASGLERLRATADAGNGLVLWGMATKGVLLATLLGTDRIEIGIDMNASKQGRFAAGSGLAIVGPAALAGVAPGTRVIVMNPNYLDEVRQAVSAVRDDLVVLAA